jgi:hypothetical protein
MAEGLLATIDERVSALDRAQKELKKPSTIPFAERRDLTNRAAKAAAELRERRGGLPEGATAEPAEEGTEPEPAVKEALEALSRAEQVLELIHAAQPVGLAKGARAGATMLHGQKRRGFASGAQSMNRKVGD